MMTFQNDSTLQDASPQKWSVSLLLLILAIVFFLFSIDMVAGSLTMLGGDTAQSILLATSNPFIGLFIGLLSTALIQSSSTVTSMIVAVVASGYLTLPNAIPMVMGANVGTTLTSTLVSLGFVNKRNQFRKAISAGSMHDFFNIFTVLLLFPLEFYYGTLSSLAESLTSLLSGLALSGNEPLSVGSYSFSSLSQWLIGILPANFFTIVISLAMLFGSIKFLSNVIYSRLIGKSKDQLRRYVFRNPYKSFGWGTLITAGVQSSSITTSLMVPLVASGRVSLQKAFPFILGANIGTTITALIAAFNRTEAALSIALVHMLFNLIGVLIFLPFPVLRRIPVQVAYRFGAMTLDSRLIGFSYIIFTFFLMPFTLIYINRDSNERQEFKYHITEVALVDVDRTIVKNSDNTKRNAQFLVYEADQGEVLNFDKALPDTSFTLPDSDLTQYVGFTGTTIYNLNAASIGKDDLGGEYSLHVLTDTASYHRQGIDMSDLTLLEKVYANPMSVYSKAHILIDSTSKMLVSAHYYDQGEKLIKSVELESVR